MKIDFKYELDKCVTKHDGRYGCHEPFYAKGFAYATNGRIAVQVPVENDGADEAGAIPLDALKAAKKAKAPIELFTTRAAVPNVASFRRHEMSTPDVAGIIASAHKTPTAFSVSLDPFLLADLAKALGAHKGKIVGVELTFGDESGPIIVRAIGDTEAVGLIMPISK